MTITRHFCHGRGPSDVWRVEHEGSYVIVTAHYVEDDPSILLVLEWLIRQYRNNPSKSPLHLVCVAHSDTEDTTFMVEIGATEFDPYRVAIGWSTREDGAA